MIAAIHAEIINASPSAIWKMITGGEEALKLDNRTMQIENPVRIGAIVTITEETYDGRKKVTHQKVKRGKITKAKEDVEISWTGSIFPFGILNFRETISMKQLKPRQTEFMHKKELFGSGTGFLHFKEKDFIRANKELSVSVKALKYLMEHRR